MAAARSLALVPVRSSTPSKRECMAACLAAIFSFAAMRSACRVNSVLLHAESTRPLDLHRQELRDEGGLAGIGGTQQLIEVIGKLAERRGVLGQPLTSGG